MKIEERIGMDFGHYPERCVGRALNVLSSLEDLPLNKVEGLQIGDGVIRNHRGFQIGRFDWVNHLPIFLWHDVDNRVYNQQRLMRKTTGELIPCFRPQGVLEDGSIQDEIVDIKAGIHLEGEMVTPALVVFLMSTFRDNYPDTSMTLKVHGGGAFNKLRLWFHKPDDVIPGVEFINENFSYGIKEDD